MTWIEMVASTATTTQQEAAAMRGMIVEEVVERAYPEKTDVLSYEMTEDEAELFLDTAMVHAGIL